MHALLPQLAAQDRHPLADVGLANYEFMLGNRIVGHEQVVFRDDGWSVKGRFEQGGKRRNYSGRWMRTSATSGEWRVSGTRGAIRCDWRDDSIEVYVGDAESVTKGLDWSGESIPLFYENLVWTVYSEMAVRLFAAFDASSEKSLTLYEPRAGRKIVATVRSIVTRQWERHEREGPVELRDVVFLLGDLEIHSSFTAAGMLVHLAVPSQRKVSGIAVCCCSMRGKARSKSGRNWTPTEAENAVFSDSVEQECAELRAVECADADLAKIIELWPSLSEKTKSRVMAMATRTS